MSIDKLRVLVGKLHALMGSDNQGEREAARVKLIELLAKHRLTWNDLPGLLASDDGAPVADTPDDDAWPADKPAPPALDLIEEMLRRHLHLAEHEYVALALWCAHTFFYSQFAVTPRLALLSPVRGCGKTTVIHLLLKFAFNTRKFDHVTAPTLFRTIDQEHPTLLIDEADNQELPTTAALRSVLNSGHHRSGSIGRAKEHAFSTFAPVCIAAIGRLPLPLMHRSIVLHMERAPRVNLRRFDPWTMPEQEAQCRAVYDQMFTWARQCNQGSKLKLNPTMPAELRNRQADNWRVLLAIADAAGPAWGKAARTAAVAMSRGQDEDAAVELLADIRDIYNHLHTDRIASATLVAALLEAEDGAWTEWRGPRGDQAPHRLTAASMAAMLGPFNIRSRTIWPIARTAGTKSFKGYLRSQFEGAWAAYCDGGGCTATHPSNINDLRSHRNGT